jgi:hypothetical protein
MSLIVRGRKKKCVRKKHWHLAGANSKLRSSREIRPTHKSYCASFFLLHLFQTTRCAESQVTALKPLARNPWRLAGIQRRSIACTRVSASAVESASRIGNLSSTDTGMKDKSKCQRKKLGEKLEEANVAGERRESIRKQTHSQKMRM